MPVSNNFLAILKMRAGDGAVILKSPPDNEPEGFGIIG